MSDRTRWVQNVMIRLFRHANKEAQTRSDETLNPNVDSAKKSVSAKNTEFYTVA